MPYFNPQKPLLTDERILISNYYLQLRQYRKYFPESSFLILDFSKLKKNPADVFEQACAFLELPQPSAAPRFTARNETDPKSAIEKKAARIPAASAILKKLPGPLKHKAKRIARNIIPPPPRRTLTEQEKNIVYERLKNDMKRFQQEYGFNTKKWGF
jgi:hypothetical protein